MQTGSRRFPLVQCDRRGDTANRHGFEYNGSQPLGLAGGSGVEFLRDPSQPGIADGVRFLVRMVCCVVWSALL